MQLLHQVLGFVAVGGALAGVAWCAWVGLQPGRAINGRFLLWFGYAVVAVTVIAAITGAVRQGSGGTPEPAHPLFAGISVIAIPIARYLSLLAPRREAWVWLAGYVVLALAMVGLFQTG
jgi:hypothetical protein